MTVQTYKSTRAMPYELQDLDKRGRVIRYTDWRTLFRSKHDFVNDFVIANKVGARFNFLELKENLYRVTAGQISAYLKMPPVARGQFFVVTDTVKVTKPIKVYYANPDSIDALLGTKGKETLNKVISLIQEEADKEEWPLKKIEVCYRKDPEVEDWEYLIIVLDYDSSFEDANKYLNILYNRLDDLAERLNPDEKDILAELIYIDIRINNDISSD